MKIYDNVLTRAQTAIENGVASVTRVHKLDFKEVSLKWLDVCFSFVVLQIDHDHPDIGPIIVESYSGIWDQMMLLFGDERDMEVGNKITITVIEMTQAKFDALTPPEEWI